MTLTTADLVPIGILAGGIYALIILRLARWLRRSRERMEQNDRG